MASKHDKDENGQPMDPFIEMLRVMDTEQLIRFRRRLSKVGRKRMVKLLSEEIKERERQNQDGYKCTPTA